MEFLGTENPLFVQSRLDCQENASQVNLEIRLRETCDVAGSEQRIQGSAVSGAAEAVAMENSDSDSNTEDGDAQPNNGRARLRKTSLSHVLLVASICGAFSCGRQAKVHRERMIWESFLGGLARPEFSRMFRMDHATFEFVVERLSPWLQRDFLQSKRGGGYISPSL